MATLPAAAAAEEWVVFRCPCEDCGTPPAAHTSADVSLSVPSFEWKPTQGAFLWLPEKERQHRSGHGLS